MTAPSETAAHRAPPARPKKALPRVAFVLSQFPEVHETFILREFTALDAAGLDFVLLSLKPCRDTVVQEGAKAFLDRTFYPWDAGGAAWDGRGVLGAVARTRSFLPWARQPLKSAYVAWAAGRLARICRRLGVGHIHSHWATAPTSAAVVISRLLGVSYSFTAHAWDIFAGDGRLRQKARGARFVVTCTGANVRAISSMVDAEDRRKVVLNYHGVPAAAGRPAGGGGSNGALRIAAVGRLVETKGFRYLLEALEGADFPFELSIVGDGPLKRSLEKTAARSAAKGTVRFEGTVPNEKVFEILAASDVLVMPSVVASDGDRDGVPNVVLEAMSVGLPVVASDISGIPEAVKDGRTGILVPPRDPTAIARALGRLREAPEAAAGYARAGRELVARCFCAEANARALHGVFAGYLARGGP